MHCTVAVDTPYTTLISLHVQTEQGFALRKSLEDWPLLVMMLLQCGACYWVMDCFSIPTAVRSEASRS